jgi:hypothetical protein
MDCILISAEDTHVVGCFPVACLYLTPRKPVTDELLFEGWLQIRALVHAGCGGEVAYVGRAGGLLLYPNNYTPMLSTLIKEPAFFALLEEQELDGYAVQLFFQHSYRWCGRPWQPGTFVQPEENQALPALNLALRQMGSYADAVHPLPVTAAKQQLLCANMPPMKWFMTSLARQPAEQAPAGVLKKTGTDL